MFGFCKVRMKIAKRHGRLSTVKICDYNCAKQVGWRYKDGHDPSLVVLYVKDSHIGDNIGSLVVPNANRRSDSHET